jgi:hypothetical protein
VATEENVGSKELESVLNFRSNLGFFSLHNLNKLDVCNPLIETTLMLF